MTRAADPLPAAIRICPLPVTMMARDVITERGPHPGSLRRESAAERRIGIWVDIWPGVSGLARSDLWPRPHRPGLLRDKSGDAALHPPVVSRIRSFSSERCWRPWSWPGHAVRAEGEDGPGTRPAGGPEGDGRLVRGGRPGRRLAARPLTPGGCPLLLPSRRGPPPRSGVAESR